MLPTIEIPESDVFHREHTWFGGSEPVVIGRVYLYDAAQAGRLAGTGLTLDRFITRYVASHFQAKPFKMPVLVLYAPSQEGFRLMACSRGTRVQCDWLFHLPGYVEYAREPIAPRSTPLVYWDGRRVYRTYHVTGGLDPNACYVVDMCQLVGQYVAAASRETWEAIAADPAGYYDYSAVPTEPDEVLDVDGRRICLTHAFVRFV